MKNKILVGILGIIYVILISGCTDNTSETNTEAYTNINKGKFDAEILCDVRGESIDITNMNSYNWTGCILIVNEKYYYDGGSFNLESGETRTFMVTNFESRSGKWMLDYERTIYKYSLECNEGRVSGYC